MYRFSILFCMWHFVAALSGGESGYKILFCVSLNKYGHLAVSTTVLILVSTAFVGTLLSILGWTKTSVLFNKIKFWFDNGARKKLSKTMFFLLLFLWFLFLQLFFRVHRNHNHSKRICKFRREKIKQSLENPENHVQYRSHEFLTGLIDFFAKNALLYYQEFFKSVHYSQRYEALWQTTPTTPNWP